MKIKNCDNCYNCPMFGVNKYVTYEYKGNKKFFILGANPGKEESVAGRPFVGRSGKLLRKALKHYDIKDYFITNAILCYSNNTQGINNIKKTVECCYPFWYSYFKKVEPIVLVTLGEIASKAVYHVIGCPPKVVASKYQDFGQIVTYDAFITHWFSIPHPSYILRKHKEKDFIKKFAYINKIYRRLVQ